MNTATLSLVRRLLGSSRGLDPVEAPISHLLSIALDNGIPANVARSVSDTARAHSEPALDSALAREEAWAADHEATWAAVEAAAGPLLTELARAEPLWRRHRGPILELAAPRWAADGLVMRFVTCGMLLVDGADHIGREHHEEGPVPPFRLVSAGPRLDSITLTALPSGMLVSGPPGAQMTPEGSQRLALMNVAAQGRPRLSDIVDLAEAGWFDAHGATPFDPAADVSSTMRRVERAAGGFSDRVRSVKRVLMVTGGSPVRRSALVSRTSEELERLQLAQEVAIVDAGLPTQRPAATTRPHQRVRLRKHVRVETVEVRLLPELDVDGSDPVNDARRAVDVVVVGEHLLDRARLLRAATGNRTSRSAGAATQATGWQILLPVDPDGPVLAIDLAAPIVEALRLRYPGLVSVTRSMGSVAASGSAKDGAGTRAGLVWDGRSLPLRDTTGGLVIVDDRPGGARAVRNCLGPRTGVASIRSSRFAHDYALYPRPEELHWVTRRGWPLLGGNTAVSRMRRWRARTLLWSFMDRTGLTLETAGPTTVDVILDGLERSTGRRYELRGIITRNFDQATLRVEDAGSPLALRVGLTSRGRSRIANLEEAQQRVLSMSGPLPFDVPRVVAKGEGAGVLWLAENWFEGRPGPGGSRWWTRSGKGWEVGRSVATVLSERAATGTVDEGWASTWGALAAGQGPSEEEMSRALAAVEDARVATAWCHGDLWPGNVLFRRRANPVVIDWDSARPDAPAGIDAVHMEIDRVAWRLRCSVGVAAALLVATGAPGLRGVLVGGRRWTDWDTCVRSGLVAAAVALRASRASEGPGGYNEPWTDEMLPPLVAALRSVR